MNIKHSIIAGFTSITLITGCAWFKANETAISQDLTSVGSCLVGELLEGAVADPMVLITGCAGATLSALDSLLSSLIASMSASSTDAGTSTASTVKPSAAVARLIGIQLATRALMAAQAVDASSQ